MLPDTALAIQSCRGCYTCRDTADHYGVSRSTVRRLWALVDDDTELPEPPNLTGTQITASLILADTQILLDRGHSLTYVARHFGVTPKRIRETFMAAGARYTVRHDAGVYAA